MKVKLLKKIRKRYEWKYKSDRFFVFDNKKRDTTIHSASVFAAFHTIFDILSSTQQSRFIRTREYRLYKKAQRLILHQKQHK